MPKRRPDNAKEWLELYERKLQLAYDNYQESGLTRYDYQVAQYDTICDALRALVYKREALEDTWAKRRRNCEAIIDTMRKPEYSRDEVITFLRDAIYW